MRFNAVVCGGTFDHFHKGHEKFLKYAFSIGKKIIIGITSDDYVRNLKFRIQSLELESFGTRKKSVINFLKEQKNLSRVEIVKIDDLYGPTLGDISLIDAIVVSGDTLEGARLINKKRKELGLKDLKILISPFVKAQDGKIISSERIRNGEVNREGKLYVNPIWLKKELKLSENLRGEFQKPFGELFADVKSLSKSKGSLIITVGDVTAKNFNKNSLGQNISVIDFKIAREKKFSNILELGFKGNEKVFNIDNPAGFITANLFRKIAEILRLKTKDKVILQVNGEEDLSVLPLVLLSPLGTIIYYGQPGEGVVKVMVSEESKDRAYNLVSKLKPA